MRGVLQVLGLDIDGDGSVGGIIAITVDTIHKESNAPLGLHLKNISRTLKRPRISVASVAPTSIAHGVLQVDDEIVSTRFKTRAHLCSSTRICTCTQYAFAHLSPIPHPRCT